MIRHTFTNQDKTEKMYFDKILWLLAWPAMIALSWFLVIQTIRKFDTQIKNDPLGEDTNP